MTCSQKGTPGRSCRPTYALAHSGCRDSARRAANPRRFQFFVILAEEMAGRQAVHSGGYRQLETFGRSRGPPLRRADKDVR